MSQKKNEKKPENPKQSPRSHSGSRRRPKRITGEIPPWDDEENQPKD